MGSKVQAFKVPVPTLDYIWDAYLRKKLQVVRSNSRFGAKLAIIGGNEHFQIELQVFIALFVLNPERLTQNL